MGASFADETWNTNFWFEKIVLAHINLGQNLDWFYEILSILRREKPDLKEFKAYLAIDLMARLDSKTKILIWKRIQDTIIVVQEPKEYAKSKGVIIQPNGDLKFRFEGKELTITRHHKDFKQISELLQRTLSKLMLLDSPVTKIVFSLSGLSLYYPKSNFFSPDNILSLISKKDSRKEFMGVVKLAAKLCSAFIEVLDENVKKRIFDQLYSRGPDFLWLLPDYHKNLLKLGSTEKDIFIFVDR